MPGSVKRKRRKEYAGNAVEMWGKKAQKRLRQPVYVANKKKEDLSKQNGMHEAYCMTISCPVVICVGFIFCACVV